MAQKGKGGEGAGDIFLCNVRQNQLQLLENLPLHHTFTENCVNTKLRLLGTQIRVIDDSDSEQSEFGQRFGL